MELIIILEERRRGIRTSEGEEATIASREDREGAVSGEGGRGRV